MEGSVQYLSGSRDQTLHLWKGIGGHERVTENRESWNKTWDCAFVLHFFSTAIRSVCRCVFFSSFLVFYCSFFFMSPFILHSNIQSCQDFNFMLFYVIKKSKLNIHSKGKQGSIPPGTSPLDQCQNPTSSQIKKNKKKKNPTFLDPTRVWNSPLSLTC